MNRELLRKIWDKLHIGGIVYFIDPLFGQKLYVRRTLRHKEKAIDIIKANKDNQLKFRKLYQMGGGKRWLNFYYTIGNKEKAFLYWPDDWFYKYIDKSLNKWKIAPALDDKNLYGLYLHDIRQPKTIFRKTGDLYLDAEYNIISQEEAHKLCNNAKEVIIKPSTGMSGGKGISFWKFGNNKELSEITENLKDFIVQEVISQHEQLSKLHKESINTLRIMTITTPSEVKVLSTVVRMGMGGSRVDNASSGGIISGVDENGRLKPFAFDSNGKRYDRHPQGAKFEDTVIPNFQNCLSLCKKAAPRLARFSKLISWDLAISKDGQPILIEVNLTGGQIDLHQMANGPIFKDEETTKEMVSKYLKK